ncbi:MAG: hypothetical protein JXM70_23580 [Pirellulales bacterium]|nr:hypothetical protein [Pirellulales bacterium]
MKPEETRSTYSCYAALITIKSRQAPSTIQQKPPVSTSVHLRGSLSSFFRCCTVAILVLVICTTTACNKKHPEAEFPEQLGIKDYGRLPGLRASSRQELQNELARIIEQQGTPEQLDGIELSGKGEPPDEKTSTKRPRIPFDSNVAIGLADTFSKKTLRSLQEAADKRYPGGRFEFNALQLRSAMSFLSRHQDKLLSARGALKRPKCDFGIKHTRGFGNDVSFIDRARLAGRLEAFSAARSLFVDDNPPEAINAFENMLQWAKHLGNERHATARLQAGMLRGEALDVLQAIVLHPRCQNEDLDRIREILHKHLAEWPSDADAWIGDRALGMHCYEVVRDGAIVSLLTPQEIEEFSDVGSPEELSEAARSIADEDELFYLDAMRKIIESCDLPYYKRSQLADEILSQAAEKNNSPNYPLVADRLLLPNINHGLRMQAEDRANTESWAIALEAALAKPISYTINPLTGKKYRISRGKKQISVLEANGENENPQAKVIVPIR